MAGADQYPTLFSPLEVAGLKLSNRIVMPPMATAMAPGSDQFAAWYAARAEGGVGLIIMEALWAPRLAEAEFTEGLRGTVEGIHAHGAPVVLQVFQPSQDAEGYGIAPSDTMEDRGVTEEEMAQIAPTFGVAAARAREAGFDGVEPHGAHGFFLNEVFSPITNRREDRYGGSLEARMALGLEIVAAIREQAGSDYPLFWRHTMEQPEAYGPQESVEYLARLVEAGVHVMDVSPSTVDRWVEGEVALTADDPLCAFADPRHCNLASLAAQALDAPVIAVGGMEDPEAAETALTMGKCDLCAVGRQLITDPQWPAKVREGRMAEIIRCTKCDTMCFGHLRLGKPIGCAQNPRSGNEYRARR
jgi:2,4-dienoyl-CoA reductase-like NADH-dependent reductase (Old Yellow Enzyme family)